MLKPAYCDYIAHLVTKAMGHAIDIPMKVLSLKYDLHPTEGYWLSSKKTLTIQDGNGTNYKITIEEVE